MENFLEAHLLKMSRSVLRRAERRHSLLPNRANLKRRVWVERDERVGRRRVIIQEREKSRTFSRGIEV
jgi:hypothetical protein